MDAMVVAEVQKWGQKGKNNDGQQQSGQNTRKPDCPGEIRTNVTLTVTHTYFYGIWHMTSLLDAVMIYLYLYLYSIFCLQVMLKWSVRQTGCSRAVSVVHQPLYWGVAAGSRDVWNSLLGLLLLQYSAEDNENSGMRVSNPLALPCQNKFASYLCHGN